VLLNIDTATEYAGVCISRDVEIIAKEESRDQKNHGAFIQPAIQRLFLHLGIELNAIDAVAVSAGPGSYTGLRVGLSTAKGLCYALQKPLILLNTLEIMAFASIEAYANLQAGTSYRKAPTGDLLFCPMIDARRMEVFTALFDDQLSYHQKPTALVLTDIPADFLPQNKTIVFSGNGSIKLEPLYKTDRMLFHTVEQNVQHVAQLAVKAFAANRFANLAYSQPFYIKEFFTTQPIIKIKNLL
jgi:tRNA threonylcarbamoyladenosine biosynthesis protein TsaB